MRLLLSILFCLTLSCKAQQVACPNGQGINSAAINMGATCTIFTGTVGNDIIRTGLTGALASQVICDTSDTCPPGLVVVLINITPVTTGTLLSSVTPTITFTDPISTKTNQTLSNTAGNAALSLLSLAPGSYIFFFYHTANTAITINTTVTTLTGNPSYNLYTRLLW